MSEILSRTVFETCLADQTEAPWEEEVRMILAHDAALRLALDAATRERDEAVGILREIATFGYYSKAAKVARAYFAAKEGK